jgi:hypothetical protein
MHPPGVLESSNSPRVTTSRAATVTGHLRSSIPEWIEGTCSRLGNDRLDLLDAQRRLLQSHAPTVFCAPRLSAFAAERQVTEQCRGRRAREDTACPTGQIREVALWCIA